MRLSSADRPERRLGRREFVLVRCSTNPRALDSEVMLGLWLALSL